MICPFFMGLLSCLRGVQKSISVGSFFMQIQWNFNFGTLTRLKLFIPFGLERNCIVDQTFLVVVKWKTQEKWPAQEEICSSIHKNGAKFGASNFPLGNLQALLRFVRFLEKRLILKSLANVVPTLFKSIHYRISNFFKIRKGYTF